MGRGPHEIRMFGRIVGAQSALQDIQWMSALQRPQWNEDTIRDITFDTQTKFIQKKTEENKNDQTYMYV